ncbi:PcfK-like family protein [Alicyclobacillus tolerans]|uniref:PcfK-like family protein n=1 Tax=Alicyclobacillus tolerans TaxID=90970 RepID=UPI001F1646FF|nr:PcfK-like family protein [Alicyclobacillus tolerans]MCF8566880.1 PcfK-like family protein [Alicyclobacillus tolerans]
MSEAAIKKIRDEMTANANNPYVQVVGNFLLQHIDEHPDNAEKVLTDGKTIVKSLDEMKKEAQKKRVGNVAVLTDAEGFAVVLKYFGMEGTAATVPSATSIAPPVSHTSDFDVKLEDLL